MRREQMSPAGLFDAFTSRRAGSLEELFEVVAFPGERLLEAELADGAFVVRRALGEGDLAQILETSVLRPGARLPFDQIVLRPIPERFEEQEPTPPALDSAGAGESEAIIACEGPATILDRFANDSSALTADHRVILARLAREIVDSKVEGVCLVGHADTRGADAYNLQLAEKRAANAEAELRKQIDALSPGLSTRIAFDRSSRGESTPVAGDDTPEGRARNRRVVITLRRAAVKPTSTTTTRNSRAEIFEESIAESVPQAREVILVGPKGVEFTGKGTPVPVGAPAYSWSVADPSIARVSHVVDSQEHANRVTVFGLRPGLTTLRQVYKAHDGSTATAETPLVVTSIEWKTLLVPRGRVEPGPNALARWGLNISPARRAAVVQLEPAKFWAGKRVVWSFDSPVIRGHLGDEPTLEIHPGFDYSALTRKSEIGPDGTAGVLVKVPAVPFNRVKLVVNVDHHPAIRAELELEVPGIVVVDPGHGGKQQVGGSSPNNAKGPVTGMLEKDLTLSIGLGVRNALRDDARLVQVVMTRECDVNVGIDERALLARCHGADVFVSIHFNGGEKKTRGTSTFVRADKNGNVNRDEDVLLAKRIQDALVKAIPDGRNAGNGDGIFDDTASQHKSLGVLNDNTLGNTKKLHPIRACLAEVEYLSNEDVDRMFNRGNFETLHQNVANAIASAIVADLESRK